MSTTTTGTTPPRTQPAAQLARLEATAMARHPLFLVGLVLLVALSLLAISDVPSTLAAGFAPSFAMGVLPMVAAFRIARTREIAQEAVETTPAARSSRTTALCAMALVPMAVGLGWLAVMWPLLQRKASDHWVYGEFSDLDRLAIYTGHAVLAPLGATLLGVAAARWWRFPAAALVLPVAVVTAVLVTYNLGISDPASDVRSVLRLVSPFALFHDTASTKEVISLTGSPVWELVWTAALCACAFAAALLRDTTGEQRRRAVRMLAVAAIIGLAGLGLAATGGLNEPVSSRPPAASR